MYSIFDPILQKFIPAHQKGFDPFYLRSDERPDQNCSEPDVVHFPSIFRKKGLLNTSLCTMFSLYLFILVAVVCDDYLVPAMERLCFSLKLSYDVAGATFLALATSSPELFVSLVGTFITKGDLGMGTIVGSSVFNVLGIATVCGIVSRTETQLDWWPITRDTTWYLLAVGTLFAVVFDTIIYIYEAAALFSLYFIYLFCLIFDRKIQGLFRDVDENRDMLTSDPMLREDERVKSFKDNVCCFPSKSDHCCLWFWFIIKYPAVIVVAITTPSARSIFLLSLFVSVLWISVTTYLLSWFITVIGYNLGIPDSIMGLTALAIGTSVTEIVSSYILCRRGYSSMAICNSISSNTFDIFVCLGLVWGVSIIIYDENVSIKSEGLAITTGLLSLACCILYSCFLCTRFLLGKCVGWTSFITYIIFLVTACTLEARFMEEPCDI